MIDKYTLENKLSALKINGEVVKISENEFYFDIYIRFDMDITYNKIKARLKDLKIFLDAPIDLSNEAGLVVLKVKKDRQTVLSPFAYYNRITKKDIPETAGKTLPLAIGQGENGQQIFFDLVKAPHLLVAGSTGSGKSVFIHNCIISLLCSAKSEIILVDVKKVEFSMYEGLSCLKTDICYDTKSTLKMLKNLVYEMEKRYDAFTSAHCRTISEYREKGYTMPYITLIIDELADLMMQDKRIEPLLVRLAQLGRASGIHLILATQRPDSTVLSGLIRANVPSRVCFAVQKATDSRIVLDMTGAENLAGSGEGLLLPIGSKKPTLFKAPYTTTQQIYDIVEMYKSL